MNMNRIFKYTVNISLILSAALFFVSCSSKKVAEVKFSYSGIIDKEYRFNVGRVIPVTISQSIETDGDISVDGKYFFYSSNTEGGNFDIYLRSMTDITTVRLTAHPSKDTNPVISPDGKKLAFVSFRDNPEGDIFLLKIDPEKLLGKTSSGEELAALDAEAVSITTEKIEGTDVILTIKNSHPVWSPDGKTIAYSSTKGGDAEIWVMKNNGKNKRKVTSNGGYYPAFSPDGSRILYISYSENKYGDIYTADINSGKAEKLTSGDAIKLYPSYGPGADRIIYSSIEKDTNGNGSLDLQDRSIVRFLDLKSGLSYALTKSSDTSFKAKWLPVLSTKDYNGIVIFTDVTGENINLNIIPETGIIPKKNNARLQYELADTYYSEYEDEERYTMALESVYNIYGTSADNTSRAYVNRALKEAAIYYNSRGEKVKSAGCVSILKKKGDKKDLYASFAVNLIENRGAGSDELIAKISADSNNKYFTPFAMEDMGDQALISGKKKDAASIYRDILSKYADFERSADIQTKLSLCIDDLKTGELSDAAVTIVNKGNTNQKIIVTNSLIDPFHKMSVSASESADYIKNLNSLKTKFSSDKKVSAILNYATGVIYDNLKKTESARKDLSEAITLSHPNDLVFYMANIRLAEMERKLGKSIDAEKYYSAAINRYSRRFKTENFRDKLLWLINYYEQAGTKTYSSKKYNDASQIYDKYINLLTLMHNKRLYPEIYAEYAPRAHVFYIDTFAAWKGEEGINELEKSYTEKLPIIRMDFNRAALYGLAYIYTQKAMLYDKQASDLVTTVTKDKVFENLKYAVEQSDWALSLDDTFIEPYLLKSWIYQFVDLQRQEFGDDIESSIQDYFPKHLWEANILLLEKAINANDENKRPDNEGNIHLNMGNSYFLLLNYPRALNHYTLARKYKKNFGSEIEKALFHFHLGYALWQNGEIKDAREEISKAQAVYKNLSAKSSSDYSRQMLTLYRYFALFSRYEEKYTEAIDWYKKILKHAEDKKIDIDRARYLQEIAFCFKEQGDYVSAASYIEQAETLLKDYPDDTRKYYLRIKLFGIGPFPVFNMGPDTAVIGNNKIFYPLSTDDKKLLNIAMQEDMSVKKSDYSAATGFLKQKVEILEKSKTSLAFETRIRSLNNLGYYSFKSGNIPDAEKYFNEAGELATEKNNLTGIFSSLMNLTNLYAMMIEEGKNDRDWLKLTSEIITKISSYRNSYYDAKFAQEKEALEAKAEAKKIEVKPEDIETIRESVEKETTAIYYDLDTSLAVMKFYRAEFLFAAAEKNGKESSDAAFLRYTENSEIFRLYSDAMKMFESAISIAEKQGNIELKVKLLLNAAICYEKLGEYEKGYVALLDAKSICDKNRFGWSGINSSFFLGTFLSNYGSNVESGDYRSLAEKHFAAAVSGIEKQPLLYSSRSGKIKIIYSGYADFLKNSGKESKAASLQERSSAVEKIVKADISLPAFSNDKDRKAYFDYLTAVRKLEDIKGKISSRLISGTQPASKEFKALEKDEKSQEETLSRLRKEIKTKHPGIAPYISL